MLKTLYPSYNIVQNLIENTKNQSLESSQATEKYINKEMPSFGRNLDDILSIRQSTRFFNQEKAIAYEDLISVLQKNEEFHKNNWKKDFEEEINIEQYILVRRVENNSHLESDRLYQYSEGSKLEPLNNVKVTEVIDDLFLQREFSQAAAIIIFVGKVEKATRIYGPRGYNSLLKKSGAIAQYSWLQSLDLGYVGTVFAGILPRGLGKISDLDGYRKCQMFAFAVGHPLEHFERR